MIRVRSLSTRLTIQFALLFAVAMLLVVAALWSVIAGSGARQVDRELATSGAVYDRLWQQRARTLGGAGQLLARDFGFREAVATGDEDTLRSALDNVRRRAGVRTAFIVGVDSRVHGLPPAAAADAARLWEALDSGRSGGIATIGGTARQLVAAPILSPSLTGWLVLAVDLDQREMRDLEQLSAIPLNADVLVAAPNGWRSATGRVVPAGLGALSRHGGGARSFEYVDGDGPSIALARPLPLLGPEPAAMLVLAYPKARALAQQRQLLLALAAMTLIGLVLVGLATWRAAGRITRPLVRLDEAAARFAAGDHAQVCVEGHDECDFVLQRRPS